MGRRIIATVAVALGLTMAASGGVALYLAWTSGTPIGLPGSIGSNLEDQGLVSLMGAALAIIGLVRLLRKENQNE